MQENKPGITKVVSLVTLQKKISSLLKTPCFSKEDFIMQERFNKFIYGIMYEYSH